MTKVDSRKCYGQVCTVARALDILGDRWTLLVLRELLGGPARFNELLNGLPGVAKNLLTERLRRLEDDGLVRRTGTAPAALYALTEHGAAVRPIVDHLGLWGAKARKLAEPSHDRTARSVAVALQAIVTRAGKALPTSSVVVELDMDGEALEVALGPDSASVTARPSAGADAWVRVSKAAITRYLSGASLDRDAFALVSGDKAARTALLKAMAAML